MKIYYNFQCLTSYFRQKKVKKLKNDSFSSDFNILIIGYKLFSANKT